MRQYVILGAGLDTFAYRRQAAGLRVFEVDYPATQAWKRERLAGLHITVPEEVTYTPVDFERETLADALKQGRFDFATPAQFAWLGVTPYLTQDAVTNTLAFVASLSPGTEIVFDYVAPVAEHTRERQSFDALAERVAALGEPFKGFFELEQLASAARALGYSHVEDFGAAALNARYFAGRADGLHLRGRAHLMRARV